MFNSTSTDALDAAHETLADDPETDVEPFFAAQTEAVELAETSETAAPPEEA